MTVAELIKELKKFPAGFTVSIEVDSMEADELGIRQYPGINRITIIHEEEPEY